MRSTTRIFHWQVRARELAKFFAHPKRVAKSDPEEERQLRLFLVFSDLGLVFGTLFGVFYFLVGHRWAALIVGVATVSLALAPWVARVRGVAIAGSLYALILVAGFTALSGIEGGMHGHAIAWLAVLPLSTCILAGSRVGAFWSGLCLVLVGVFWMLEIRQVPVPALYPKAWAPFITGSGYLALTVFMSLLGVFFENGRRRSLERLQTALQELSVANERLRCLDAERREFLGIAAHDLRGPLTLIVGHAQLGARRFSADAPETESFRQIGAAGDRMRALLDGLLGDQAIEEGRLDLCPVDCDTERLTADAVARHRPAAERKGISLRHVPAARLAYVRADRGALDQILDNLISNALKFSPPGRPVTVGARVVDHADWHQIFLEVTDSGPGLSEEDFGRLFGRFTRLSAQPTGGETSTGLGLSIVKRLAGAIGGDIACRSRPGAGATFALALPGVEPAAAAAIPSPTGRASLLSGQATLLHV